MRPSAMMAMMRLAPATVSPLRAVSTGSVLSGVTQAMLSDYDTYADKQVHFIGSGPVARFRIRHEQRTLSTHGAPSLVPSAQTIQEMWVMVGDAPTGLRVRWGGAGSVVLASGATEHRSDWITAADLGFSGRYIPRGTKLRISCVRSIPVGGTVNAGMCQQGGVANSSFFYAASRTTLNNVQGPNKLTINLSSGIAAQGEPVCPYILEGEFYGADYPVFAGIGDSIMYSLGDSGGLPVVGGMFGRLLFDDETTLTNPRAGINFGVPGGVASAYGTAATEQRAWVSSVLSLCNVFIERYGANGVDLAASQAIWVLCRSLGAPGGRVPKVAAFALTPRVTGTMSTTAGQTPSAAFTQGGAAESMAAAIAANVGQPTWPDYYIDGTEVLRASSVKTDPNYWKWRTDISVTSFDDGLHLNAAADSLLVANGQRAWAQSIT